jgi:hypothetical protein
MSSGRHQIGFRAGVAGQAFADVDKAVAELSRHAVSRMLTSREQRKTKGMARQALVDR